jgi:hypothetical protein
MYKFSTKLGRYFARLVPALGIAFLANAAALNAAQQAPAENTPEASYDDSDFKRWSVELGLGIYACDLSTFIGAEIAAHYYLAPRHRLKLGLGILADASPQSISGTSFSWTGTDSYGHHTSGIGHLETTHMLVPVTIGYQYEIPFDKAQKWKGRVGAELGFGVLTGSVELDPHVTNYKNNQGSDSGVAFMAGLTAGINWTCFKTERITGAVDFSITAYATSEVKLEYEDCRAPGRGYFDLSEEGNLSGAKFALTFALKF